MLKAIMSALSGLNAARRQVEAGASNIANLQSTGSLEAGGKPPYEALRVEQTSLEGGVKADILAKKPPFVPAFDPDSPHANAEGLVGVPNVDLAEESVRLLSAKNAYKANVRVLEAEREMSDALLESFDKKI